MSLVWFKTKRGGYRKAKLGEIWVKTKHHGLRKIKGIQVTE